MFNKQVKRQQTPFGVMIHKRGPVGSNLLITKNGRNLGLRHGKKIGQLLKSVRIDKKDRVHFSENVHPVEIGFGQHARVFRLFSAEQAQFIQERPDLAHRVPSFVLKLYRRSVSRKTEPDGFTQFFANTFAFNWLKNQPTKTCIIRPLSTFFVSEFLKVRKFVNAPTLEEAYIALMDKRVSHPLGQALTNEQIYRFLERNKISFNELERMDAELMNERNGLLVKGAKIGFGTGIEIEPDPIMKNAFVLGKGKDGRLLVSVFDQGKTPLKGLVDRIRKGKIFLAR